MLTKEKFQIIKNAIIQALDDDKAQDINDINVENHTDIAYYMIIATGTSSKHVQSLANKAIEIAHSNMKGIGINIEGLSNGEWVLVDVGGIIIHVFQSEVRALYDIKSLFNVKHIISK